MYMSIMNKYECMVAGMVTTSCNYYNQPANLAVKCKIKEAVCS